MNLRGIILDFWDDIKNIFKGINYDNLPYNVHLMGDKGAVILGVRDLVEFSNTQIILNLKNSKILLEGINLLIRSFKKNEIFIEGKILKVGIF